MRLHLAHASSPAPIDLNAVRLETLHGAVADARRRLALRVRSPPDSFTHDERTCWGFALGEVDFALDRALRHADQETAGAPPHEVYRRTRDAVAFIARVCRRDSEPRNRYDLATAIALEIAADELTPIVRHADRAPAWLRQRARRTDARADSLEAFEP